MVYLVAATTVTLESSDSVASSVEESAMDTGKCSMHTYKFIHVGSHLDLAVAYGMDPEGAVVVEDGLYFLIIFIFVWSSLWKRYVYESHL